MKKMLVMLALATVSFANAQKGTILVGGNVGYSSQTQSLGSNDVKTNQFSFSPKVGYQLDDNWTVGGEFTVGSSKGVDFDENEVRAFKTKINTTKLGAFVRYAVPLSETFSAYADFGVGYQSQNVKNNDYFDGSLLSKTKADGMYVGITPALFINMKKGFGLNFSVGGLGYSTLNYDDNGSEIKNFDFNFGQTVNIGVSKNF